MKRSYHLVRLWLPLILAGIIGIHCIAWGCVRSDGNQLSKKDPFRAAEFGNLSSLKAMVEKDRGVVKATDSIHRTPLHYAAEGNQPEVISYLVAAGADLEARANAGDTPLHAAAVPGSLQAAQRLIELGANPNARQLPRYEGAGFGASVLDRAASRGHRELVKLLLDHGAKVQDENDPHRDTALHWACMGMIAAKYVRQPELAANGEVIAMLMEHFSDINVRNRGGMTPLHVAAEHGAADTVKYLLDSYPKIDIDAQDGDGNTALHLAIQSAPVVEVKLDQRAAVVRVLLDHGAKQLPNHLRQLPSDLPGADALLRNP
jgi:ankyrin repeat protein